MSSAHTSTDWLRYYRSALIDADRMAQKLPENAVSLRDLRELSKHHIEQLLPAIKRSDGQEERARQVEVQISPLYFVESASHRRLRKPTRTARKIGNGQVWSG